MFPQLCWCVSSPELEDTSVIGATYKAGVSSWPRLYRPGWPGNIQWTLLCCNYDYTQIFSIHLRSRLHKKNFGRSTGIHYSYLNRRKIIQFYANFNQFSQRLRKTTFSRSTDFSIHAFSFWHIETCAMWKHCKRKWSRIVETYGLLLDTIEGRKDI